MIEKFRKYYEEKLWVKLVTVTLVVLLSMLVMLPVLKLAEFCGVNIIENNGLNLKVDLPNVFFFYLFIVCSSGVIWAAQKYIHNAKLLDLGFRTKVFKLLIIGFLFGAIKSAVGYGIMILTASTVTYTPVIPDDVSIWSYAVYYIYFLFGFIVWNSFVEELVTRAYPIEKLRKHMNPQLIFIIMGIIFTAGHFFVREFNLGYCLSLFIFSYLFSIIYHYSNSIWLVIGIHSGVNWVGFSFFGTNWKLGALIHIEMAGVPYWISAFIQAIVGLILLIFVVYIHKKGFFKSYALDRKTKPIFE